MVRRRRRSFRDYYSDFEPSHTIPTEDGLKARSQRGAFAKNWWATRWIEALEKLLDPGRLRRGRSYARSGQVLSIDEVKGGIDAWVQGSRPKPYKVTIQVSPLSDSQWEMVVDALAEQALFTAQLLAGEMPVEIEDAFQAAGVSLFPKSSDELITSCSCPDWANPCKHVAAAHFILGERFDDDPFLLFRLRGRSQEQILQALRLRRAGQGVLEEEEDEDEVEAPLEESIEKFWETGAPLDSFSVTIRAPQVEAPLLKRLGDPTYVPEPGLQSLLSPAYEAISQAALETAVKETAEESDSASEAG